MANKIFIRTDANPSRLVLTNIKTAMEDLRILYADIGEHFRLTTRERFDKQIAPDGTRWKPNADSTLLAYINKKTHGKGLSRKRTATGGRTLTKGGSRALAVKDILYDYGTLRDKMVIQVTQRRMLFGAHITTKDYARTQQFGRPANKNGKGKIPARPFIGVTPNDISEIQQIILKYLSETP